jgi:cysteine-rich repeat protein
MRLGMAFAMVLLAFGCDSDDTDAPPAEQETDAPPPGGTAGPDDDETGPSADASASDSRDDAGDSAEGPDGGALDGGRPPLLEAGGYLEDGAVSVCGDGIYDPELEDCDSAGTLPALCEDLGYSGGTLGCTFACVFDTTACLGDELCADTRDNDGDGLADCSDSDCDAKCMSSCDEVTAAPSVASPGEQLRIDGSTVGHAGELFSSCGVDAEASEVVYRYTPSRNGVLGLVLESGALLVASVQTSCAVDATELGCELIGVALDVPIRRDEPVFIIVKGREQSDEGAFTLLLDERGVSCGNGVREGNERCDDGNENDRDGCTTECELNVVEMEPNQELDAADDYQNPHYAELAPEEDIDLVRIEIAETSSVRLRAVDLGDGACLMNQIDPYLRLLDDAGEVLYEDDDTGDGYCPDLALELEPGTYYAEITNAGAGTATFPYRTVLNVVPAPEVQEPGSR